MERNREHLEAWDAIQKRADWKAILIGNGASRAVWAKFEYDSLYEIAHTVEHRLTTEDDRIFEELHTRDFERALGALRHARIVNRALNLDARAVTDRYRAIQLALAEAVAEVHVPWSEVSSGILRMVRQHLLTYRFVFSTNYDLLVYWAILADDPRPRDVKDFFWTPYNGRWLVFEPSDTDVGPSVTRVLYLHGGLHLYSLPDGRTGKYLPSEGENLLDAFRQFMTDEDPFGPLPLFVTEGNADDKRAAIASSDYLSFAYEHLAKCDVPIVVFGHSLGDSDSHIAKALNAKRDRPIAISMVPRSPDEMKSRRARYEHLLPRPRLYFFDATTHPLGDPTLRLAGPSEVKR